MSVAVPRYEIELGKSSGGYSKIHNLAGSGQAIGGLITFPSQLSAHG
jgi:hypothetical protein